MNKNIIQTIISFILGAIVMFLIVTTTYNPNRTQLIEKTSINKSINKIYDATVLVETYKLDTLKNTGTGFFYKKDNKYAYIITNEHVINGDQIEIVTSKDERVETEVLGKDQYLDLAVLRVDKKYAKQIAIIGNSEDTKLGDTVFTVGSPLGYKYNGSIATGILSGKNRQVEVETTDEDDWIMKAIQIDASINPGNSGGPLLNINGEVIGIVSLKLVDDDVEGMGFAIPIEYAKGYMDDLEKGKTLKRPVLGISMSNIDDTSKLMRNNIDVNNKLKEGVVVLKTKENIPLKKGDIITKINNNDTKDIAYLKYELYKHNPGDTIKVTYYRNNHKKISKIKLKGEK